MNPFNITQAKDFSDDEILKYWVDLTEPSGSEGFDPIMKPASLVPMLLLGSKGSGKTHLMRYYSFVSQAVRHKDDIPGGLAEDGYVGIYVRMGGLNASRFNGKGRPDEYWLNVFAYYMDLWLGQVLLGCCLEAYKGHGDLGEAEGAISKEIIGLFTHTSGESPGSLRELSQYLSRLQKHMDRAVNDVSTTDKLEVDITVNPGALVFGIPKILSAHLDDLGKCTFVYLLDELE